MAQVVMRSMVNSEPCFGEDDVEGCGVLLDLTADIPSHGVVGICQAVMMMRVMRMMKGALIHRPHIHTHTEHLLWLSVAG